MEQLWFGNKGGNTGIMGMWVQQTPALAPSPPLVDSYEPGWILASISTLRALGFYVVFICKNNFHSLDWSFLFLQICSAWCQLRHAEQPQQPRCIMLGPNDKDQSLVAGLVRVTVLQLCSHAANICPYSTETKSMMKWHPGWTHSVGN